jgi:hypothetical protein
MTRAEVGASTDVSGLRRISAGGYDYGDCGGMQLAVLLHPEPCAEAREVLIERAAASGLSGSRTPGRQP